MGTVVERVRGNGLEQLARAGRNAGMRGWRFIRHPWATLTVQVLLLVLATMGFTAFSVEQKYGIKLDPLGGALLVVAGGAFALSRRWPLAAFVVALGSTLAYVGLGNQQDGPYVVGIMATLAAAVVHNAVSRSFGLALLTVVAFAGVTRSLSSVVPTATWAAVALIVGHALAERRAYVQAMEDRARLAEQTREAEAQRRVAEERLRIARELHDVLSHTISVINVQAGVAAHLMGERPEQAQEALVAIKHASKGALQELRGLLGVLRDSSEERSLAPEPGLGQLGVLVESARQAGLPSHVELRGKEYPLSPVVDLAAYRIVQESLTNALRYAGPASATVTITYQDDAVVVEVVDDGRGVGGQSGGAGAGIAGMRERALAVGGELEAEPRREGGFGVRARLPCSRADQFAPGTTSPVS